MTVANKNTPMETVLLQINNDRAYKLLDELEAQHLITLLEKHAEPKQKLSARFAGSLHLSDEEYNNFQNAIQESRSEWERDI